MQTIRPSSDLRNHYADISRTCKEEKLPVYITVNGRGDTVIMAAAHYEQMKAELELLRILADSEEDVENGRVAPIQDCFTEIRQSLPQEAEA